MTASDLEKSDLGKNRFYSVLNMPYPNGKIIAVLESTDRLLVSGWPIASAPMTLHAAIWPHT